MEGTAARMVFGRSGVEEGVVGNDGGGNGKASWRRGEAGERRTEGSSFGAGGIGQATVDRAGLGEKTKNRHDKGENRGAIEKRDGDDPGLDRRTLANGRSEEHTSELQSHSDLVCRLLLEKK